MSPRFRWRAAGVAGALWSLASGGCDGDTAACDVPPADSGCNTSNHHLYACDGCGYTWVCSANPNSGETRWYESDVRCECLTDDGRRDQDKCPPDK
jgi:hypothetical protein